jgi:hypothetical protein
MKHILIKLTTILPEVEMIFRSARIHISTIGTFGLLSLFLTPSSAWSWGRIGHQVASTIAEERLTPHALAAVQYLLGQGSYDCERIVTGKLILQSGGTATEDGMHSLSKTHGTLLTIPWVLPETCR